jgi:hypothetical protein
MHLESGRLVGTEVGTGEGSRQTSPNQAAEVHDVLGVSVGVGTELGTAGAEVMGCEYVWVVGRSWHPQKNPGVWHSFDVGAGDVVVVSVGSLQPNQPGVLQSAELVEMVMGDVCVAVGYGVWLPSVVVSSLHPNQPGVLHVEVDVVVTLVLVVVPDVVVVSSRHPHHPGV